MSYRTMSLSELLDGLEMAARQVHSDDERVYRPAERARVAIREELYRRAAEANDNAVKLTEKAES